MVGLQAHAAARCAMVGTEAMGFFNLAVYGLRAVWYPAFTIALTAEGRGGHASPRYLRATPGLAWRSEGCNSCNRAEEPQARSNSSRHAWERALPPWLGRPAGTPHPVQCFRSRRPEPPHFGHSAPSQRKHHSRSGYRTCGSEVPTGAPWSILSTEGVIVLLSFTRASGRSPN
jgi:hypothetical protein